MIIEKRPFRLTLLMLFLSLLACKITPAPKVVGYYTAWQRGIFPAEKVAFKHLTHIAHAFIWPKADGSLAMYDNFIYPQLVARTHQAGKKIIVSIGGWGNCDGFPPMAANASARARFVENVKNFCLNNGYDGADIDWEFPQSEADRINLNRLMQELRTAFDAAQPNMLLTMAVPVSDWSGKWFDFASLKNYTDWIGGMTYDFHGSWTNHAGHNSPLFAPANEPEGSVDRGIQYLLSRGLPPEKIFLGIPFYGKEFTASQLYGLSTGCVDRRYSEIIPLIAAGWTYHWDNLSQVPYLTNPNRTKVLSFDDTVSVRLKCEYVRLKKLGGVIIWELSQDDMGNSQPLLETIGSVLQVDTSAGQPEVELPNSFVLAQNYPNPFNSRTTIRYYVPQAANIRLEVLNLLGERVAILADEPQEQGWQEMTFEAKDLPSGIYVYQLTAPSFLKADKMVLVR
ncbi:MAG: glycosyl hydrolase family 18 protein [candidate division KSB1 bacterium]|nr:glycosyl hydrolase family 18 protein [candidate division KSB1 bacterium]